MCLYYNAALEEKARPEGQGFVQVNYFPSRFDPVRQSERFPENRMAISGARERRMLDKVRLSFARLQYLDMDINMTWSLLKVSQVRKAMVEDGVERTSDVAGEQLQAARG